MDLGGSLPAIVVKDVFYPKRGNPDEVDTGIEVTSGVHDRGASKGRTAGDASVLPRPQTPKSFIEGMELLGGENSAVESLRQASRQGIGRRKERLIDRQPIGALGEV